MVLFPLEIGTETPLGNYVSTGKAMAASKKAVKARKAIAKKALAKYQSMRDFTVPPSPAAASAVSRPRRLRYVIQKHEATRLHYDFRLELERHLPKLGGDARPVAGSRPKSGWRWRWKTIRWIMAISKAPSPRASMAAAR